MIETSSKSKPVTFPSHTDSRFDTEQTVYGAREAYLAYEYSDRLMRFDIEAYRRGREAAEASRHERNSCNWFETYLSAYYEKRIEVKHILAVADRATGHPLYVLGFRVASDSATK